MASPEGHVRVDPRRKALAVLAVFLLVVGGWEAGVVWTGMPAFVLPAPSGIARQLLAMATQPLFWRDVGVTLQEVLLGYGLAIAVAAVLGTAIAQVALLRLSLMPYIVAFQTVPSVALAPLFLQWFGYGLMSKVVMAALIAFFPLLVNVIAGLQAAGQAELQMARAFGATRWQLLRKVRVPNALPYIFAGLELGVVFALVGAIVAEFVGAKAGLGNRILQYNEQFNIAGMFGVLLVLALLGMLLHGAVTRVRARVLHWAEPANA